MNDKNLMELMKIIIKSVLKDAGGQLTMLEMATRAMQKLGDDRDPREMIEASGFLPDDIIKLTDKGYRSIEAAGND